MGPKELGFLAENIAARHLENGGYELVARNFRKPWGEIDIICRKDGVFVFVEVKSNRCDFGDAFNPEIRANSEKIRKIKRTAELYLDHELGSMETKWQIDIIAITFDKINQKAHLKHFKNV